MTNIIKIELTADQQAHLTKICENSEDSWKVVVFEAGFVWFGTNLDSEIRKKVNRNRPMRELGMFVELDKLPMTIYLDYFDPNTCDGIKKLKNQFDAYLAELSVQGTQPFAQETQPFAQGTQPFAVV